MPTVPLWSNLGFGGSKHCRQGTEAISIFSSPLIRDMKLPLSLEICERTFVIVKFHIKTLAIIM